MDKWLCCRMASGYEKLKTVKQLLRNCVRDTLSQQMLFFHWPRRFTSFLKLCVSNILMSTAGNFVCVALNIKIRAHPKTHSLCAPSFGDWTSLSEPGPFPGGSYPDPPGICCSLNWWCTAGLGFPGHCQGHCFLLCGLQVRANVVPLAHSNLF